MEETKKRVDMVIEPLEKIYKCSGISPVDIKWEKFPHSLLWFDDCTFIGAIEVKNTAKMTSHWEYHWLAVSVWGDSDSEDSDSGGISLTWADEECADLYYSAWTIEDFDYIAIVSGSRPLNSDGSIYEG